MSRRSYPGFNSADTVSTEEAEILSNSRRRGIIKALSSDTSPLDSLVDLFLEKDNDPEMVDKRDVVEQIAVWEEGMPVDDIHRRVLKSIQVTTHQHHFPKLEDEDIINHYPEEGLVEPKPVADEYAEMIEERPYKDSPFPGADIPVDADNILTTDGAYEVLSNDRRRYTLGYMGNRTEEKFTLGELSEHVAERLKMPDEEPISSSERKTAYISLAQCHLPKLDRAGVIEYNDDRKTLEKGEYFEDVARYLPDEMVDVSNTQNSRARALSIIPLF